MKEVKEVRGYFGNVYEIFMDDNLIRKINIVRVNKIYNNFNYIFLLNSRGEVIQSVFDFINFSCNKEMLSARQQAASALKLLYSFSEIIMKKIEDFEEVDINNFSNFLLGQNVKGNIVNYILKSKRSITTHNQYIDIIRKYLNKSSIKNKLFFHKITVSVEKQGHGMMAHTKTITVEKYKTNLGRHCSYTQYVPKYISLEEYKEIINFIEKHNSKFKLRNILIINLMYMRGLRLGEVLGITLEDIITHPDNSRAGLLYLRNRVSDNKDQHAKTCIKVLAKEDYKLPSYNKENKGYQVITIPPILMDQIRHYIDISRDIFSLSDRLLNNIMNHSIADSVIDERTENYYLFLNKNGTTLSADGWSKFLKMVFVNVGLKIDKNTKEDNLSHRLRHGYAMYLRDILNKDEFYVKREMRHKSIRSTYAYYNPRPDTILKEAEKIQDSIINNTKISK